MSRSSAPPPPPLTRAQRQLFGSEPDVPEKAVEAALRGMRAARFGHLSRGDLLSIATLGAMEAARTFDPTRRMNYPTWAFFKALYAVLQAGRAEHTQHAKARAMLQARVMVYFAELGLDLDVGFETETSLTEKLHDFSNPLVGLAVAAVATAKPTTGGEDEAVELEAAARAGDALREALPDSASDARRMIEMHFAEGRPLTEVAAAFGVAPSGYRTLVRRFHEVLASIREGLGKRGIRELPPWRAEVSGRALAGDG